MGHHEHPLSEDSDANFTAVSAAVAGALGIDTYCQELVTAAETAYRYVRGYALDAYLTEILLARAMLEELAQARAAERRLALRSIAPLKLKKLEAVVNRYVNPPNDIERSSGDKLSWLDPRKWMIGEQLSSIFDDNENPQLVADAVLALVYIVLESQRHGIAAGLRPAAIPGAAQDSKGERNTSAEAA